MINIMNLLTKKVPNKRTTNFFELSSREKMKIIKKAGIEAQKEQSKVLREYDVRFGSSKVGYINS